MQQQLAAATEKQLLMPAERAAAARHNANCAAVRPLQGNLSAAVADI